MRKRERYSREFKIEALRLWEESEKTAVDVARELGIKRTLLYRWKQKLEDKAERAFRGSGRPKADQVSEVSRLKQELKAVKEERDILKKPQRTLPGTSGEVRVYQRVMSSLRGPQTLPCPSGKCERLLRLATAPAQSTRARE